MEKALKTLLALCCAGPLLAQNYREQVLSGNQAYGEEKFDAAEIAYRQALEGERDQPLEADFNLGNALYKQGRYAEASQSFQRVLGQTDDSRIQALTWHNLGNIAVQEKKYQEAVEAYQKALLRNPKDNQTRYNLAKAMKMLEQQQQEQKQNEDQQNQDQEDQKKNPPQDQKQDQKKDGNQEQEPKDQPSSPEQKQQNQEQQQQGKPQKDKISRADAERLLEALERDEEDLQQKLLRKMVKPQSNPSSKDW